MEKIDKTQIWARAKLKKATPTTYCSDKSKYHSMTIANGTVVDVGEMPDSLGAGHKWCLLFKRPKGYYICAFLTTEKAKLHLETIKDADGNITYSGGSNLQKLLTTNLIDTLINGVAPMGKTLNPATVSPTLLNVLKKELL